MKLGKKTNGHNYFHYHTQKLCHQVSKLLENNFDLKIRSRETNLNSSVFSKLKDGILMPLKLGVVYYIQSQCTK